MTHNQNMYGLMDIIIGTAASNIIILGDIIDENITIVIIGKLCQTSKQVMSLN